MENIRMDLRLFDANTQVTTQQNLTEEMKTFYSDYLIDAAEPELVHDQFAQKHPIPANGGKTIQFRRFAPLGKALTALTEGVTPDGQSLSMSTVEAAVRQYGGYIQMSDLLLLTAIDNNLTMATKLLGAQAGRTLDTITREVLVGGDNVQYADESVSARYLLRGGNAGAADNNYLTVDCIRRAVRALKNANCRRIDGAFPVIIHPDVAYDLMNDPKWLAPHQYVDTEHMYEGEIGKIEGCRFVESTEAKIFHAEDLAADSRTLLVVVDTNRPDQVENASLLEACTRVAVIDHHRRAANYISNATMSFHEPYASSACELMAELLEELVEQPDILHVEAEAMLSGIMLDTKDFTVRTGERTFEAAAFLRRAGADTSEVKKLLQTDMEHTVARYKILQTASIYRADIAIAAPTEPQERIVAAQAADELLNIAGVTASRVIYPMGTGDVFISARSIGELNVQLVMEALGGGGSRSSAAVQLHDVSVAQAVQMARAAIDDNLEN